MLLLLLFLHHVANAMMRSDPSPLPHPTQNMSSDEEDGYLALYYAGNQLGFFIPAKYDWGVDGNETKVRGPVSGN